MSDSTFLHGNVASENQANDGSGLQGGQSWVAATPPPTTERPTGSPTRQPNLQSFSRTLRGLTWYDRNANGRRDSNINVIGMSADVEFTHGVGGVSVQLVECDGGTGRAYIPDGNEQALYAAATTAGVDARGTPGIVRTDDQNGKYNLVIPTISHYYYVQVQAPYGYLFTTGLCNDNEVGWECDTETAVDASSEEAETAGRNRGRRLESSEEAETGRNRDRPDTADDAVPVGIPSGRSTTCVYVDADGQVQTSLNFGVMRQDDTQDVATNVALMLDFEDSTPGRSGRRLEDVLRRATVLDSREDAEGVTTTRYLLGDEDKQAIGTVTAEVLAATLDGRLAQEGVDLDSVNPKEVIVSTSIAADADQGGSQLAVAMEIRGHYSPPPSIDFDYLVQDSINRDTSSIRRGLRDYNSNCRDQTSKVQNEGAKESDFNAVVSMSGAASPGRGGGRPIGSSISDLNNVFSRACSSDLLVPNYFETSLKEIEARKVSEVEFGRSGDIVYVAEESRGLDAWAMGPVAGIAGLIVLLIGAFVFRRALGPRRVDMYSATKTKDVGKNEMRRFGEAGGDMDDGSVDSAFYSDASDDDSDMEETEKERKMRRKRKEKEDEQKPSSRSSRKKGSSSGGAKSSSSSKKERAKLAVSQGSDDTDSVGKYSNSSEEVLEKSREKKRAAKERSDRKSSSSSSKHRDRDSSNRKASSSSSSKRGKSKRSSDNSKIV